MIGHLLSSFAPLRQSQTRESRILESVTEDEHTRGLLFPDAISIQTTQGTAVPLTAAPFSGTASTVSARSFDDQSGDLELDHWKDVRIIIAQDEIGSHHRTVLYDSKQPSFVLSDRSQHNHIRSSSGANNGTSPVSGRRVSAHIRRTSLSSSSEISFEPPSVSERGVFNRNNFRRTSLSSMPNIEEIGTGQTKELDEMTRTYLDCMFGNTAISYKGPTTKLHHITPRDKGGDMSSTFDSRMSNGPDSLSRIDGRKRSQLGQGHYSASLAGVNDPGPGSSYRSNRESGRRNVMVTRTFTVPIPDNDQKAPDFIDEPIRKVRSVDDKGGSTKFSDRQSIPNPRTNPTKAGGKLRKLPSYAIAMIFLLPPPSLPSSYKRTYSRSGRKAPTSLYDQDVLGSSADSERHRDWIFIDRTFSTDTLASTLLENDANDRLDVVTQHWDIISRILACLQHVVQKKIRNLCKAGERNSMDVALQPLRAQTWNFGREMRSNSAVSYNFRLPQHALSSDREIKIAVDNATDRILRGIRIPRVITGQGRWGIWREEARWIGLWAGGREQNFFFFNLLTAFLGHHTEWLSILGPSWYRKRHQEQQKSNHVEALAINNRTILVSSNKMAARRLIFLLSAFLPATQPFHEPIKSMKLVKSASMRAYSQSPPASSLSRETSLRRQINRRPQPIKPTLKNYAVVKANVLSPLKSSDNNTEDGDRDGLENEQSSRRQSADVKNSRLGTLPTPTKPENIKLKCPAVTTSRDTTSEAIPVAHFMNKPSVSTRSRETLRPGSSGSIAEANLIHNLQRSDSANMSNFSSGSHTGTRWGSFMSLWSSSRRESSTDQSDCTPSADDGLGISGINGNALSMDSRRKSELQKMVDQVGAEAEADRDFFVEDLEYHDRRSQSDVVLSPRDTHTLSYDVSRSQARAIPERQKSQLAPLKLSVNENDGVIDVDVPIPGFGSMANSPILNGLGSFSNLEESGCQQSFRSGSMYEFEQPTYVAGWLKSFHPDFVLQAVTPYAEMENEIKNAMKAEPSPPVVTINLAHNKRPTEKWVDVCTTLIANAQTFSIKRLRLRRHVRLIPQSTLATASVGSTDQAAKSQYGNPYSQNPLAPYFSVAEHHLEERFIEEPIMDMDGTLADAIEQLLAQNGTGPGPGHGHGFGNVNSTATSSSTTTATSTGVGRGIAIATGAGTGTIGSGAAYSTANPSRAPSIASSPSTSWRGRNEARGISESSRGECKEMVMGALREVVKSVTSNWAGMDKQQTGRHLGSMELGMGMGIDRNKGTAAGGMMMDANLSVNAQRESTLREGIRRWLSEVDEVF